MDRTYWTCSRFMPGGELSPVDICAGFHRLKIAAGLRPGLILKTSIKSGSQEPEESAAHDPRNQFLYPNPQGPYLDEEAVLKDLQDLDPRLLTTVHEQYYPVIYRYARFRLPDQRTAEDVSAEVFLRLIEAIKAGKGPRSSLRGWLMGTVANLVNDVYRRQYQKSVTTLSDDVKGTIGDLSTSIEATEQARAVREAIRKLTKDQQHVIALRFGAEFSVEETAVTMGKKPNAIKQLQFRALAALRRHLEGTSQ